MRAKLARIHSQPIRRTLRAQRATIHHRKVPVVGCECGQSPKRVDGERAVRDATVAMSTQTLVCRIFDWWQAGVIEPPQ